MYFIKSRHSAAFIIFNMLKRKKCPVIEVNEYSMSDIIQFLNHSSIEEELELTDHFIIQKKEDEVLVFNETTEMFVKNPEDYRVYVEFSSLIYQMNQHMSQGLRKIAVQPLNIGH